MPRNWFVTCLPEIVEHLAANGRGRSCFESPGKYDDVNRMGVRAVLEAVWKQLNKQQAAREMTHSHRKTLKNIPSQKSSRVARISPVTYHDYVTDFGSKIVYCGGPTMILKILIFKNWLGARYWGNGIMLLLQTFYRLTK